MADTNNNTQTRPQTPFLAKRVAVVGGEGE
jgi:hypothetical protein